MKRVVVATPAARDLSEILKHLATENPELAEQFFRSAQKIMAILKELPTFGVPGRLPGTREVGIPDTSYTIVYKWIDDTMVVLAILHTFRDPIGSRSRG